jgi:purine catabolism regulator
LPVSISVRDLADQPHLRIEVLAGAGGLDRDVTWAHSSDLPEPWDWLSGGELLMKNGRTLPRSPARQAALVEGLARAGAAALVIGADPDTPAVAGRVIARADTLGLPILRVPYSVSFIVLSRTVADASIHEESRRLARASRIYATIRDGVTGNDSAAFLCRLEAELGCRLHVVDAETGASFLEGTRPPPAWLVSGLAAALARHGGAAPGLLRVDAGEGQAAVAVEIPYEEPISTPAWRRRARPASWPGTRSTRRGRGCSPPAGRRPTSSAACTSDCAGAASGTC